MKTLLFTITFLLSALAAFSQTANYTASATADLSVSDVHNRTLLWNLYDTLSGANDTLIITLGASTLHQYAQASLCATWLATGTTTSSFVSLQGRNASHETWQTISTATFASEVTTVCDNDPVPYVYVRLLLVSAANIGHVRTTLAFKKL